MTIGIIGAGASGMAAALAAAENGKHEILLFERQARVGRKLSATGNGRCNLTNLNASKEHYHGTDAAFVLPALEAFGPEQTLRWFSGLGLFTVAEESGRVYPYSDQANSVVDILRFAVDQPAINLISGFEVDKIRKTESGFLVQGNSESYACGRLIIACGGLAGTKLGGSMSGYKLLRSMGHSVTRLRPTLVQLKSDWKAGASLKGVRTNCRAAIARDGEKLCESTGELQFTEYGLSGPVIFEISRDACQGSGYWTCELDFLPDVSKDTLFAALDARRERNLPSDELLTGILHNRLGRVLTQAAGIGSRCTAGQLSDYELNEVVNAVKAFSVHLTEPMGMDSAQVTAGGILTSEFDPVTMESRLVSGLYACGEVLDIDGDCGGYNLQWAWSSGRMAGLHAGRD